MRYFNKIHVFSVMAVISAMPFVASATEIMATKEYVDLTTVTKHQGTQGQMLQVNSSGDVALVTPDSAPTNGSANPITSDAVYDALEDKEDVSNKLDGASGNTVADYSTNITKYPSAKAVAQYGVQKPATATAGQVLMYGTGATADSRPVAQYIQVPMATGDPAASGTVSGTASIWLQ